MKIGIHVRARADGVDLRWLGQAAEERGIESLFLPEHTHLPIDEDSRHPGGEELSEVALTCLDPLIGLATISSVTSHLRLGTGVLLIAQHDPIVLAKAAATLDALSGGRLLFGIGAGWNKAEMRNHGVEPSERWAVMREKTLAVRALWTEEQVSYTGEFVHFGPVRQEPKPAQRPHPSVLVGGEGRTVLDRVLDYGDGWVPNYEPDVIERIGELARRAEAAGRDPIPITVYATPHDPAVMAALAAAGVERCVFNIPSRNMSETERALDELLTLVDSV